MSLNISLHEQPDLKPSLCVFGVGGAGGNAVNNMIHSHLDGVDFWVTNTDAQSLNNAATGNRVQLGAKSTKGLGAGSHPEIGKLAAEESIDELKAVLQNYNMVFITAGMGGGTGTGAAPVIAKIAKELNILTVGVVTKPFHFEGARRMKMAELGLEEMQKYVDTLIVIPNQNLFRVANEKTTFADAFRTADDVLHSGVRGITDLITMPGLINLDFADIRTVVGEMGKAMMGTGEADGENRAIRAAESAISNPLLDNSSMKGAKAVLINITGGTDMTLYEVDEAANRIKEEAPDATIIFGSAFNSDLQGKLRVSVVATGIDGNAFGQHTNVILAAPSAAEPSHTDIDLTSIATASNEESNHFEDLLEDVVASLEVNKKLNESFIPPQAVDPEMSKEFTQEENKIFDQDERHSEQNNFLKNAAETPPNIGLFGRVAASFARNSKNSVEDTQPVSKNDELFDVPSFMRRKMNDK